MPGIISLMQQIHDDGLQIGVVTGSGQKPLIQRILKDFGMFVDVAHITTAYDVRRGKPQPDPYLKGLMKAGDLQPYEAIVVENAPMGVRAAVAAGALTIGVNTGILKREDLALAGADIVLDNMRQVAALFKD